MFNTWNNVIAPGERPPLRAGRLDRRRGRGDSGRADFADFAGLWLFGQTNYGWQAPEPTGSFSASTDSTSAEFSGASYPYSCEKYQLILGSAAAGKDYTISVDQGPGASGMLFQLYSKAAADFHDGLEVTAPAGCCRQAWIGDDGAALAPPGGDQPRTPPFGGRRFIRPAPGPPSFPTRPAVPSILARAEFHLTSGPGLGQVSKSKSARSDALLRGPLRESGHKPLQPPLL